MQSIGHVEKPTVLILVMVLLGVLPALGSDSEPADIEPELLGPLTREEVESAVPDWIEAQIDSSPDPGVASELFDRLDDAEITVVFGTWCSDSKRELNRFWRAADDAGVIPIPGLSYIGVDRSKTMPEEAVEGRNILYVPTFIVIRNGEEIGRVVEESPDGIEADLLAILEGRKQGLVTAKSELLEAAPGER